MPLFFLSLVCSGSPQSEAMVLYVEMMVVSPQQ